MTEKQTIGRKEMLSQQKIEKRKQTRKKKQMKKKRLIIRNLAFKISEDDLKKIFSKFGEITDLKIPLKKDGKKRGFAFIQYKDTRSQIKAIKEMNFKEIEGRPIAIDFAVDKTTYQSQLNSSESSNKKEIKPASDKIEDDSNEESLSELESEAEDETANQDANEKNVYQDADGDSKVAAFLKEFDADDPSLDAEMSSENSDDSDVDEQSELSNSEEKEDVNKDTNVKKGVFKKQRSQDVSEGKTVFIRNLSFNIDQEDLQEVMEQYGETDYCLLCVDPATDQFKGTAFVKFKEKQCADKFIQESSEEPGIFVDNRKLLCTYALSKEDLSKQSTPAKVKDKRNLYLLKYGLIKYGSEEAEGVSKTDMAKRAQLEVTKKRKLKNVNFFVSDKRLMIHNLPKNVTDKDLRFLFIKAAGKEAVIKEARVMRDFKKTDAQGIPVSKGFGFVAFTDHDHALKALMELNNNPRIFTSNARPIVEFSIENKVALLSQEKRRERLKMLNKKRLDERIKSESKQQTSPVKIKKKKRNLQNQPSVKERKKFNDNFQRKSERNISSPGGTQRQNLKKKQKKHSRSRSKKGKSMNDGERSSLSLLANKYKEKLLNKCS